MRALGTEPFFFACEASPLDVRIDFPAVTEPRPAASLPQGPPGGVWPLVVIGAGAAGLLAGISAGRANVPTLVLETRPKPGAKIRVSGGGRCNVLPSQVELGDFHTEGSRNALKNLLASWPLASVREFFERELGIALAVEPTGKVFPRSNDPREVVDALLASLAGGGATLAGGVRAQELVRLDDAADGARFEVRTTLRDPVRARSVALATGGLSLPKTGSDGWGYKAAFDLGHAVLRRYPALVPLLAGDRRWTELAGLSLPARLRAVRGGKVIEERTGDFLFTHKGFSGPVVLDQSHHLTGPGHEGVSLVASWQGLSAEAWDAKLVQGGPRSVSTVLRETLPRRLAVRLLDLARVDPERKLSELPREERRRLVAALAECPLETGGDEGYGVAEVTGGGVPLDEVSTKTLESRLVPGLYFCGEVLDVTGRIGGYNFLWAWISGRMAGRSAASAMRA